MKLFSCHVCKQLLFFESVACTRCGHLLAYLPDLRFVSALEAADEEGVFTATAPATNGARYRHCQNRIEHDACNWAVPVGENDPYCVSCRLNQVIPNLTDPAALQAWRRLELAKRRMVYTLVDLGLPVATKKQDPGGGLAFSFLADDPAGAKKVFTGHSDGLVTINIAEADDPHREKTRLELGEAYRTLLGHFRHEVGHYYWDRLVRGTRFEAPFRELFGDENADYAAAQQRHYNDGPPPDWRERFVSAYASMHPWEDWAETWAHLLHMTDTLETARAHGLTLKLEPTTAYVRMPTLKTTQLDLSSLDDLITSWGPITIALNNLNRSMGLPDPYPFVLSEPAITKLRFVHSVVRAEQSAAHDA